MRSNSNIALCPHAIWPEYLYPKNMLLIIVKVNFFNTACSCQDWFSISMSYKHFSPSVIGHNALWHKSVPQTLLPLCISWPDRVGAWRGLCESQKIINESWFDLIFFCLKYSCKSCRFKIYFYKHYVEWHGTKYVALRCAMVKH